MPKTSVIAVCAALLLVACGTSAPAATEAVEEPEPTALPATETVEEQEPPEEATEEPTEEPTAEPTEEPTEEPAEPTEDPSWREVRDIDFESLDGTPLVGTLYPPMESSAAYGILLLHWMPGERSDWGDLINLLQTESGQDFYFFAIDFRGHGDSGGDRGDRPGYIDDAQAALELFRTIPLVDPDRIFIIGASIGSDAAADACGEGCIGAISLSPGSYTGMDYNDALAALGDKPVLCVAADADSNSPTTCLNGEDVGLSDYQVQIYTGSEHAMEMFNITDQPPLLNDLLLEWLLAHIS